MFSNVTWEFLRFEWREQMRSGLLWMFALFFGLLAFGAMSSEAVQIGGGAGGVFKNAPTVVINILAMFTLLAYLLKHEYWRDVDKH